MAANSVSVTIGIPVYNAEKYIERCLDSVLDQTFDNYEVLIVDDCGIDDSMKLIEEIANNRINGKKIRIVRHEKNKGVAEARNMIIDEAAGKYLFFMDSDDRISKDAISILFDKAENTNAETVWGSFVNVEFDTEKEFPSVNGLGRYPDMELFGQDCLAAYGCLDIKEHLQQSIWNILYRTDFIRKNHLRFKQHGSFDDGIFQAEMQPLINRAVLMSNVTYYYYHRPNSLTNLVNRKGFSINEAISAIEAVDCHREICRSISSKPYFECRVTKVLKEAFFISKGILKHRDEMDGDVSDSQIKNVMSHPATLYQIIHFKQYRLINLIIYFVHFLPSFLYVKILLLVAKLKS
jgi:glycosyltransferase involved in cell wall biosynthesis